MTALRRIAVVAALSGTLTGCGRQAVLTATGAEAERVATLSWLLFAGGAVILLLVVVLTVIAIFGTRRWRALLAREALVTWGGIAFPIATLSALLVYDLAATRAGEAPPRAGPPLRIAVVGEQWWWRVIYTDAAGRRFESANELRIPVGRTVELHLTTADVLHSFWVPNLAGKLDMVPGRTNVLRLAATQPGTSRGQCAEYCGGAHALMAFEVVALPAEAFERWFAQEAMPAAPPADAAAEQGRALFLSSGCGGCHTVRGSAAAGTIGPDLTHVGRRLSLAAASLGNDAASVMRWIADNQHIKPENRMPPYRIFSDGELAALAHYLAAPRR